MKQIADLAGVSIGTVDRALKNKGRVKKEVAKRIWDISNSLDYKPNTIAKSLAQMNQNLRIAVILHNKGNLFFDLITKGIEQAAEDIADYGISVVIKRGIDFSPESQLALIKEVVAEEFAGLVIVPINNDPVINLLNELSESGFPIVALASYIPDNKCLAYVGCDYRKAGYTASGLVRLMATSSKHKVAYVTPPLNMLGHRLRLNSFQESLKAHENFELVTILETANSALEAYTLIKKTCEEHPEIDVWVLGSNGMEGCLKALEEMGKFGLVTIIAFELPLSVQKGLIENTIRATIVQQPQEEGRLAVRTVFDYITSSQMPKDHNLFVPCDIFIKESL